MLFKTVSSLLPFWWLDVHLIVVPGNMCCFVIMAAFNGNSRVRDCLIEIGDVCGADCNFFKEDSLSLHIVPFTELCSGLGTSLSRCRYLPYMADSSTQYEVRSLMLSSTGMDILVILSLSSLMMTEAESLPLFRDPSTTILMLLLSNLRFLWSCTTPKNMLYCSTFGNSFNV